MWGRSSAATSPPAAAAPVNNPFAADVVASPSNVAASPNNAASGSAYNGPPRQYRQLFTHQYGHVTNQCEQGLMSVKRTTAYFNRLSEQLIASTDASNKALKAVREKYKAVSDEATHYVNAGLMIEEVLQHTEQSKATFGKAVANDLVKPMRLWYKNQSAKRDKIDRELQKFETQIKNATNEINRERSDCLKLYQELKTLTEQKRDAASRPQSPEASKIESKWRACKDKAVKKFQTFDAHLDNARTAQTNFFTKEVPIRLEQIEAIERERLAYEEECFNKFMQLYNIMANEMKQSNELVQKVLPTLNITKAMNLLFDKWTAQFGPPSMASNIPYDLPCHWSEIQNDNLEGGTVNINGGGANSGASFAASPMSQSHNRAASNDYSQNNNHYAAPPPPAPSYHEQSPVQAAHYEEPAHAAAQPVAGGGEAPLFIAEALFDFDLPSDGGEISYVNFKAGDHINVFQEGDEWWYGEVRGISGFFPSNYSRRM